MTNCCCLLTQLLLLLLIMFAIQQKYRIKHLVLSSYVIRDHVGSVLA